MKKTLLDICWVAVNKAQNRDSRGDMRFTLGWFAYFLRRTGNVTCSQAEQDEKLNTYERPRRTLGKLPFVEKVEEGIVWRIKDEYRDRTTGNQ